MMPADVGLVIWLGHSKEAQGVAFESFTSDLILTTDSNTISFFTIQSILNPTSTTFSPNFFSFLIPKLRT